VALHQQAHVTAPASSVNDAGDPAAGTGPGPALDNADAQLLLKLRPHAAHWHAEQVKLVDAAPPDPPAVTVESAKGPRRNAEAGIRRPDSEESAPPDPGGPAL